MSNLNKIGITLLGLAVLTFGAILVVHWARDWDNAPVALAYNNEGELAFGGTSVRTKITCSCPTVFTQSIPRVVNITIDFEDYLYNQYAVENWSKAISDRVGFSPDKFSIIVYVEPGNASVSPANVSLSSLKLLNYGFKAQQSFDLKITANDTNLSQLRFHFFVGPLESPQSALESIGSVSLGVRSHATFWGTWSPIAYVLLLGIGLICGIVFVIYQLRVLQKRTEKRLAEAADQEKANPQRARYAWDVARVKLEAYFDRNLLQVNLVFWFAVFVMAVGFGFILAGVLLSLHQPTVTPIAAISAISGLITQFIGATFMVIYKSTMSQANEFMVVLERINSVGMAVQVLDSIPESNAVLKDATRAQIVPLLLGAQITPKRAPSAKRKKTEQPEPEHS